MKKMIFLIGLVLLIFLVGCAPKASSLPPMTESLSVQNDYSEKSYEGTPAESSDVMTVQESGSGDNWTDTTVSGQDENIVLGTRIVIKNADLVIVVVSPADGMDDVKKIAVDLGGYVSASNLYKRTTSTSIIVPEATITIRVPADSLDSALTQIKSLVQDPKTDIISENVSAQDVTKEYTDLNSRLKNLQNTEEQLQTIMDEAYKTEDVLIVYNELTQVREQIEVLQGQINYYKDSAAYSTISINLMAQESVEPLSIGQWKPAGVAQDALQTLLNALKFFTNAGIWIILFILPVFIIIALPFVVIFLIIRGIVLRNKAKKASKSTVTENTVEAK